MSRNEPQERYIKKKALISIVIMFEIWGGVLTMLYRMLMTHWCCITPYFPLARTQHWKLILVNWDKFLHKLKISLHKLNLVDL